MKISDISWKPKFDHCGVSPKAAYEAIEEIREECGGSFSAEMLVAKSRDPDHVLHPILYKDSNTIAARKWRIHTARTLLRAITVTYSERPKSPTRAFEIVQKSHPKQKQQATIYSSHEDVMKDPVARERLIAEAVRGLLQWRRRFQELNEFEQLFRAIDESLQQFE